MKASRTLTPYAGRDNFPMSVRFWHVGDVLRKLREQHGLSSAALSRVSGVSRSTLVDLEQRGPGLEAVSPLQWVALDQLAVTFGFGNGAALYKLVPDTPGQNARETRPRVVPFGRRPEGTVRDRAGLFTRPPKSTA